jgi:hypothetical protein
MMQCEALICFTIIKGYTYHMLPVICNVTFERFALRYDFPTLMKS